VPIPEHRSAAFAWRTLKQTVADEIVACHAGAVIELGGGRHPLFARAEAPACVTSYTLNDISECELALAPDVYDKAAFDVCGEVGPHAGRYDFAFSRMLAEHVPDGETFHRNVFRLLRPGGRAFHFMPILYSPPFVLNRILPAGLAERLLLLVAPYRTRERYPYFPARYSMCRAGTPGLIRKYRAIGYGRVEIEVFFGNEYLKKIPVLGAIDAAITGLAYRGGFEHLGAYAFVRLGKPA
jgi:SAM-dependent methyltransferase